MVNKFLELRQEYKDKFKMEYNMYKANSKDIGEITKDLEQRIKENKPQSKDDNIY